MDTINNFIEGVEMFAETAFELNGYYLALQAAEANPTKACEAAWAGPGLAKQGIDFIRWIDPNLDTSPEMKEIEDSAFSEIGGGAGAGATIGGGIGAFAGPAGAAIGAALGGCAGSVVGAVKFVVEHP